jgi:hypothetical protein
MRVKLAGDETVKVVIRMDGYVKCPYCHAPKGMVCQTKTGKPTQPHQARAKAAEKL